MSAILKNRYVKVIGILVFITAIVNIILAIIAKLLPVKFEIPSSLIDPPHVFYNLNIGKYVIPINQTVVNTWVIMIMITLVLYFGTRKLSVENPGTIQVLLEELYNFIDGYILANFRGYKKRFLPFFTAMFSMLLLANLSLFLFPFVVMVTKQDGAYIVKPFFRPATADINTTVGLALVVFVLFISCAIIKSGIKGFFKELCQPFIFMLPLNIISELAKPINISMRLFGNMFAGLIMGALLYGISISFLKESFSLSVAWPVAIQLYLDLFVGVIQAFIFTVLASVYVQQSLIKDEE